MGEYVGITIGNYDFLQYKNSFYDSLSIFSMEDLKIEHSKEDGRTIRYFETTVGKARMCLDIMGHTIAKANSLFNYEKKAHLDYLKEYGGDKKEITIVERELTFENWTRAVKKYSLILASDTFGGDGYRKLKWHKSRTKTYCEKVVMDSLPFWHNDTYFGMDFRYLDESIGTPWEVLRIILEAFPANKPVILDYTNLYKGGWCGEVPEEKDFRVPKTVILTEGATDISVISDAMKLLYPHIVKYYSFFDFSTYNIQGSTNYLTHSLKAFVAAGIKNRIIALYDNDSAGISEIKALEKMHMPSNVRILHLPDLEMCRNYPTIGPSGCHMEDVNGRACSIEMFVGKDILKNDDGYIPVRWKSYMDKIETYQGEIISKSTVLKKFEEKAKKSKKKLVRKNWAECDLLLQMIFNAFR